MRAGLLVLALAALIGCDRESLGQDVGGEFEAQLSGAVTATLNGTATFTADGCAAFTFAAPEFSLFLTGNCDGEPGRAPPRGGFSITETVGSAYTLTFRVPTGESYRAVSGTVEIDASDRETVEGRFSAEARPLLDGAPTDDSVVTLEGTFEAVPG